MNERSFIVGRSSKPVDLRNLMNTRSSRRAKSPRLLSVDTRKRNVLVRDREILEQKRSELAEVAFDLFLDRGFHRTGVREIAAAAGLSVGAVFTYFRDK